MLARRVYLWTCVTFQSIEVALQTVRPGASGHATQQGLACSEHHC